jgi:hypothetical protein
MPGWLLRRFRTHARRPHLNSPVAEPVLSGGLVGKGDLTARLEAAVSLRHDHREMSPAPSWRVGGIDHPPPVVIAPLADGSLAQHAFSMLQMTAGCGAGSTAAKLGRTRPRASRAIPGCGSTGGSCAMPPRTRRRAGCSSTAKPSRPAEAGVRPGAHQPDRAGAGEGRRAVRGGQGRPGQHRQAPPPVVGGPRRGWPCRPQVRPADTARRAC